jgi:hypothetical protein
LSFGVFCKVEESTFRQLENRRKRKYVYAILNGIEAAMKVALDNLGSLVRNCYLTQPLNDDNYILLTDTKLSN